MKWTGIKALRDGLRRFLDDVRQDRTTSVTDHGRPVARPVPIDETGWGRLIAEGGVEPAAQRKGSLPDPIRTGGTVSDLIHEQRRYRPHSTPPSAAAFGNCRSRCLISLARRGATEVVAWSTTTSPRCGSTAPPGGCCARTPPRWCSASSTTSS